MNDLAHGSVHNVPSYILTSSEGHESAPLSLYDASEICADDKERLILGGLDINSIFRVGAYTWTRIA